MADIKVRVGQQNATKVISSLAGAQTLSLTELSDVNAGTLRGDLQTEEVACLLHDVIFIYGNLRGDLRTAAMEVGVAFLLGDVDLL